MNQAGSYKKFTRNDVLFFIFLLSVCVAGSVGIFWFAVGMENGNAIMRNFLEALLDNALGIVVTLLLFNIFLAVYYSRKR